MAYTSQIDFPTDTYGALTTLVPALVDALNKARMSRSTFDLLKVYLKQSTDTLNKSVKQDLEVFEHVELKLGAAQDMSSDDTTSVPSENTATETPVEPQTQVGEGNDITSEQKPATGPENSTSDEITPLPAISAAEEAEDAATAAEIAAAEAEVQASNVILKP